MASKFLPEEELTYMWWMLMMMFGVKMKNLAEVLLMISLSVSEQSLQNADGLRWTMLITMVNGQDIKSSHTDHHWSTCEMPVMSEMMLMHVSQ